jgi:tetratricopeptide (TPR) repeat protein
MLLSAVLLGAAPAGAAPLLLPDAEARLRAARAARRGGEFDQAARHLQECARCGELTTAHWLEALLLRAERGEVAATEQALRELACARGEYYALIAEGLVRAYLRQGRLDDAEELLDRWRVVRPSDAEEVFCRGLARQRRSTLIPLKAAPFDFPIVLPGLAVLRPTDFCWQDERARNAQLEAAAESFRLALRFDPSHREARLLLATTLLDLGRLEEAARQLKGFGAGRADDPRVLLAQGRCRALLGDERAARGLLAAAVAREPRSAAALRELGRLELRAAKFGEAAELLAKAHALAPKDLGVLELLLECQTLLEKKEAVEALAEKLNQLRRIEDIIEARTKQLHDPQFADKEAVLRAEIGRLHGEAGRGLTALYWAQGALRVNPSCEYAHGVLKGLYEAGGMKELADHHARCAAAAKQGWENSR